MASRRFLSSFLTLLLPIQVAIAADPQPVPPELQTEPERLAPDTDKVLLDAKKSMVAPPEFTLEPVVTEGTPMEALKYDAIQPAQERGVETKGSNGAITRELQNNLPFHFADNARAGSATSISGSVRGAEEVDVNVLGVPLNFPQGGGFYLQSLPQYLWSGYVFQLGPSMGAFDPRGVAGSLSLRLWSAEALTANQPKYEIGALHSTQGLQQFYAGAAPSKRFAGRAGYSVGDVEGPGASFSSRLLDQETFSVKLHLLGAKQKVDAFQSERSSTATAEYTTARVIPVLQADAKLGNGFLLKNAFFYDNSYLRTEDPSNAASDAVKRERSHVYQGGVESALVGHDLRLGFGARQTDYHRLAFSAPTEKLLNAQATYTFHPAERTVIEPTIGGVAVNKFGFKPMATLGARHDYSRFDGGVFARVGYHNRIPSLLDRYYSLTFPAPVGQIVAPNPNLKEERVYSAEIGSDFRDERSSSSLTFFGRYSKDARYYSNYVFGPFGNVLQPAQIVNNGDAYVYGVWHTYDRDYTRFLSAGTRAAWTRARFKTAHQPYLYQPELIGIFVADVHDSDRKISFEVANRGSTSYFGGAENSASAAHLPGYYYMDLTLRVRPIENLTLLAAVENVFDRQIEFRQNQKADVGRYYVMSASYSF